MSYRRCTLDGLVVRLCAIVDCWCVGLLFAVVYVAWFWCLLCAELLSRFGVVAGVCWCFEFLGGLRVGGLGSVVISGFLSIAGFVDWYNMAFGELWCVWRLVGFGWVVVGFAALCLVGWCFCSGVVGLECGDVFGAFE